MSGGTWMDVKWPRQSGGEWGGNCLFDTVKQNTSGMKIIKKLWILTYLIGIGSEESGDFHTLFFRLKTLNDKWCAKGSNQQPSTLVKVVDILNWSCKKSLIRRSKWHNFTKVKTVNTYILVGQLCFSDVSIGNLKLQTKIYMFMWSVLASVWICISFILSTSLSSCW